MDCISTTLNVVGATTNQPYSHIEFSMQLQQLTKTCYLQIDCSKKAVCPDPEVNCLRMYRQTIDDHDVTTEYEYIGACG